MGTWGTGIMDNDVAADAKARFDALISQGTSVINAVEDILQAQGAEADDADDYPDLVLALAWLASSRGAVPVQLANQARLIITSGKSAARWAAVPESPQRQRAEADLLNRLNAPPAPPASPKPARRPRKLPYREGDWVLVPLDHGGFAAGLVARMDGKGKLLGYFFGPRLTEAPTPEEAELLSPEDAIYVQFCGDPGIITGKWKVLFRLETWSKTEWPLPAFGFEDKLLNATYRRLYQEDTLKFLRQERVPRSLYQSLPPDGAGSARSVESYLDHVLPVAD